MKQPTFNNIALQTDSLGEAIQLNPEDIIVAYEARLTKKHILIINDVRYGYELETDRDRDRDLAMALLLKTMQDDDGVQLRVKYHGAKVPTTMGKINENDIGVIYAVMTDKHGEHMHMAIADIYAEGYEIQAPSPKTTTPKESKMPKSINDLTAEARRDQILNNRVKDIRLGDYVETTPHGHRGRVSGIANIFSETNESNAWFANQSAPYDEAQKMERWISILCDERGAVLVAESRVTIIPKFDFTNPYAEEYFRD